ncbi:hypothetical protein CMUS01_04911 [Colletotrichum musicola]|uniref:Uncharacterized protein n=1 Tax=Colletotrichum musicola TaxID=2175873 RepID=A0A8H6NM50_9PEZI|nr:hypothetical protein CMUS01_04911 [Colletotrichum musicola]
MARVHLSTTWLEANGASAGQHLRVSAGPAYPNIPDLLASIIEDRIPAHVMGGARRNKSIGLPCCHNSRANRRSNASHSAALRGADNTATGTKLYLMQRTGVKCTSPACVPLDPARNADGSRTKASGTRISQLYTTRGRAAAPFGSKLRVDVRGISFLGYVCHIIYLATAGCFSQALFKAHVDSALPLICMPSPAWLPARITASTQGPRSSRIALRPRIMAAGAWRSRLGDGLTGSTLGFRLPKEHGQQDGIVGRRTMLDRDMSSPVAHTSSVLQDIAMKLHRIIEADIERHTRKDQQTTTARDGDMLRRVSRRRGRRHAAGKSNGLLHDGCINGEGVPGAGMTCSEAQLEWPNTNGQLARLEVALGLLFRASASRRLVRLGWPSRPAPRRSAKVGQNRLESMGVAGAAKIE